MPYALKSIVIQFHHAEFHVVYFKEFVVFNNDIAIIVDFLLFGSKLINKTVD